MSNWEINAIRFPRKDELIEESIYQCDLINFNETETPLFIQMVFNNKHLTEESKNEFRKKVVGKYLFFFNKKYIKVINTIKDSLKYGTWEDDRYFIQISNHIETQFIKYNITGTYSPEYNGFGEVLNPFKTSLYISNSEEPEKTDTVIESYMLVDTGCTITSMPTEYWNFKTLLFMQNPRNYKINKEYSKPQILNWNRM